MSAKLRREFSEKTRRLRYEFAAGKCEGCREPLQLGKFDYHHLHEAIHGGDNSFDNCRVLCSVTCHPKETKRLAKVRAKIRRVRDRNKGIRKTKWKPMPGTKRSGLRKRMDGTVERR